MEVVQHDINVSMRTILIDWLVEVVQVGCGSGKPHFTPFALRANPNPHTVFSIARRDCYMAAVQS